MTVRASFIPWTGGAPAALSKALFTGELPVFETLAGFAALSARARLLVETHFGPNPQSAEARMTPRDFRAAAGAARRAVRDDAEIDALWTTTLAEIGYQPEEVRRDRMRLRVVPAGETARSRFVRPLPVHRDSWGSGIMAQVNWWAPLYPLDQRATMLVWPEAFERPVANTAGDWEYERLLDGDELDYPLLPVATQAPPGEAVPVLIEPGMLLGFAAAHLHGSVADARAPTRFGLDTRTVWEGDLESCRGAPNVDGGALVPHWEMFARAGAAGDDEQGAVS